MSTFKSFNLQEKTISNLASLGYYNPSWIQERVIPKALKGDNIVAQSETGSGKTHAFLIPIIDKLDTSKKVLSVIIFCPTRELARQTWEFAHQFCKFDANLRISLLTSGTDRDKSLNKMSNVPHIIIGTPGRIKDIITAKGISFNKVSTVVLDEADMLLDLGYLDDIDAIITKLNNPQVMVFSATLKENLKNQLSHYIKANEQIINEDVQAAKTISHFAINTKHMDRNVAADIFLKAKRPYSIIIFCSTVEKVKSLYDYLRQKHYDAGALYGELSARERKTMMRRFKNAEFQILVSSDVGARGIDVDNVTEVLNIDLPREIEYYFHRAGRTGRFGKKGECYTFYDNDDSNKIKLLMNNGISFSFLKFKDGELISDKGLENKVFHKKEDAELTKQIQIARSKVRSKKVKPGYKKKMKNAEQKVKKMHKRELIKKDIRRQRVERYVKEGKHNG